MNTLLIEGKEKDVKEFKKFMDGKDDEGKKNVFSFENVTSSKRMRTLAYKKYEALSPKEKKHWKQFKEKFPADLFWFNTGGYEWCVKNWGTKWNSCHADISIDEPKKLCYNFSTAWSPCNPVIEKLIFKFRNLKFKYEFEEWGDAIAGVLEGNKGHITRDDSYDIDIGSCPECDYTNTKPTEQKKYVCGDCGHKYTNEQVKDE
jgi:hypothetical protein